MTIISIGPRPRLPGDNRGQSDKDKQVFFFQSTIKIDDFLFLKERSSDMTKPLQELNIYGNEQML